MKKIFEEIVTFVGFLFSVITLVCAGIMMILGVDVVGCEHKKYKKEYKDDIFEEEAKKKGFVKK